ncbi:MAG: 2,3,4,5-tetrahydropyridine-2,6-dicarboxylate N-succinyltransferase, partial [Acidiferrobacterales bacterium]
AVIAPGMIIDQSTRIYNRLTDEIKHSRVPKNAVIVPGALPSDDGKYTLDCAVITRVVDPQTRDRLRIHELLRGV